MRGWPTNGRIRRRGRAVPEHIDRADVKQLMMHIHVACIVMTVLPVDGGMGAGPELAGVGPVEDIGRIRS